MRAQRLRPGLDRGIVVGSWDTQLEGEHMLTLTENASTIVKTLTGQAPEAEDAGLRISSSNPESTAFAAAVAPSPEPADEVVEVSGARLFLEHEAAVALDDKILDAQVDANGSVSFAIGALA
jgi:iron-sulfur cluster assembly protein